MNEEEHVEIVSASSSPLVVSCLKCKNIVGDTYSYVCHDQSLNVMALSAVCNIKRSSNTVFTSKSGGDAGCTFTNLYCENCDETIGKFYITTSRLVDNLRDKFSLFVDKISVYKVGTANIGQYPPPEIRLLSDSSSNEQPLVDEIVKVRYCICFFLYSFSLFSFHSSFVWLNCLVFLLHTNFFPGNAA